MPLVATSVTRTPDANACLLCFAVLPLNNPQTPSMAIVDANLVDAMPRSLTVFGGLDALVHGLESYVSVCATDFTKGAWLFMSADLYAL